MIADTPGFFGPPDAPPLYGVWHAPAGHQRDPIVLAPALFDERRTASAPWVALARFLAANGHPVLRFEFRGEGESLGDGVRRSWADVIQDLRTAGRHTSQLSGSKKVHVVALRLGASIAWETLHANPEPDGFAWVSLIAIAPIIKGASLERLWRLRTKIRQELGGQNSGNSSPSADVLDLDGLPISAQFMQSVKALDLTQLKSAALKTHIIQISFKEELSNETKTLLQAGGENVTATGLKLEPFWDRLEMIDTSALNQAVLANLK